MLYSPSKFSEQNWDVQVLHLESVKKKVYQKAIQMVSPVTNLSRIDIRLFKPRLLFSAYHLFVRYFLIVLRIEPWNSALSTTNPAGYKILIGFGLRQSWLACLLLYMLRLLDHMKTEAMIEAETITTNFCFRLSYCIFSQFYDMNKILIQVILFIAAAPNTHKLQRTINWDTKRAKAEEYSALHLSVSFFFFIF